MAAGLVLLVGLLEVAGALEGDGAAVAEAVGPLVAAGGGTVLLGAVGVGVLAEAVGVGVFGSGSAVLDGDGVDDELAQLAAEPSALLVAQKLVDSPVPTEPAPIIVTSEMPATITPYSTDVTPRCERARNPNM